MVSVSPNHYICLRYKDGRIIPLEQLDDVVVMMTKEDKQVISVLKIKNLSRHRSESIVFNYEFYFYTFALLPCS